MAICHRHLLPVYVFADCASSVGRLALNQHRHPYRCPRIATTTLRYTNHSVPYLSAFRFASRAVAKYALRANTIKSTIRRIYLYIRDFYFYILYTCAYI